jgi:hypothetical protein
MVNFRCIPSCVAPPALSPPTEVIQVPYMVEPPQWRPGLVLQDGKEVTFELVALLSAMLHRMNEAARDLPALRPFP